MLPVPAILAFQSNLKYLLDNYLSKYILNLLTVAKVTISAG